MGAQSFLQHLQAVNEGKGTAISEWFHQTVVDAVKKSFDKAYAPATMTQDALDERIEICFDIIEQSARGGQSSRETAKNILTPLVGKLLTGNIYLPDLSSQVEENSLQYKTIDK